mgnify:CR=1 FL=1
MVSLMLLAVTAPYKLVSHIPTKELVSKVDTINLAIRYSKANRGNNKKKRGKQS